MSFSEAQPSDVEAVVALVQSAYRGEASRLGWTTEADLIDGQRTDAREVSDLIARPDSLILLAGRPGALLGTCHLQRRGGEAGFGMFAVRPALQGSGIGRAIVEEAFRIASVGDATRCGSRSYPSAEDLITWYKRLGFQPTGETEPFPYGDERFGRPRRDDLEFVVLSAGVPS